MKKSTILISLLLLAGAGRAQELIFEESVDLNSDDKIEQINLKIIQGTTNQFILKVADKEYKDGFSDEGIDGFRIIDINKYDKFKEVVVHSPGSSDDDEYIIFWYDGENIIKMDRLARWPKFLGNGILYVDNWEDFWVRRDKWVLDDNSRILYPVPQFAYYVGVKIKVVNGFSIYRDKDLKETVALLSKDSEIELLLCDISADNWFDYLYLIKSGSGLTGWAKFEEIYNNSTGFPLAD